MKLSRNDPCPCASGKKYKHCCYNTSVSPAQTSSDAKAHDGAIEKCMTWLATHQRKAWQVALANLMEQLLDEQDRQAVSKLDDETIAGVQINLTEWLLAHGSMQVKGEPRRIADYLIGPFGPTLAAAQRDWIQQLAQRPLRLYRVTDVRPGAQITLCDALQGDTEPVVVLERSGSQSVDPGMFLGVRVMRVEDHFELSGAAYQFSVLAGQALIGRLRDTLQEFEHQIELPFELARVLITSWLQQYVSPPSMPTMIDHYSGQPIVSITDHYRVNDWNGLIGALEACAEIEGDRFNGWTRIMDFDDGQQRPFLTMNPSKKHDQVEVFYTTQLYADQGRTWVDALVGKAVTILTRQVSDPKTWIQQGKELRSPPSKTSGMPDIDPQELTKLIAGVLQRTYANWCDEPIPTLDNKTPRQAIQTSAGLERVKGLLRSYESNEIEQARQQGRAPVSYDFLWDEIGLPH